MAKPTRSIYSYSFLIPGAILFMIFFLIPTLISFYFSLTDWNLIRANFVGLDNFKYLLTNPDLNIGFKNTFIFTVLTTILKVVFGLLLALLVNRGLKFQNFLRTVFFFPVILSTVAVGLMFSSLYYPTHGLINSILTWVGLGSIAPDWLGDIHLVIYSVSWVDIWKGAGFCMVIILAGLQSVSKDYYEAAAVDGGNSFDVFKHITIPMVRPALFSAFIICLIGGLRAFDIIWVTTKGGPGSASEVIGSIVYRQFADGYFGIATAAGLLLFILVSVIVFPTYLLLSRKEVEM
ncbi:MAG TPA: ABC transporter [Firmicutes bacterium]|jgi:raffinose/stachyose/melibiose transport system permease protein|nr:ABC transporter [Bacillota bacterium]